MSGTGGQFIKSLTVNGEEVTWGEMNEDGTFVIQFELPGELSDELDFGMVISPPGTEDMEHVVSLSFAGDIPGESDESEDPAEDPEEEPTEEPAEEPEEEPAPEPEEVVEEENLLTPDKAYEIDYIVKHETEDKASAADNFFEKPGILLEKDGAYYLQVTVTSSDMIDSLETEFGPALIVEDNGDSKVVQIRVNDDLSKVTILDMHITVPGMYSMNHSARVYLDESSMKEVDVDNYELVAGTEENLNGPLVEGADPGNALDDDGNKDGNTNDGTPNKPDFGDNDDNGTTPGQDDGKGKNPQTGDTSGILLYTLLLIGSMIPLAAKLKRRFI